MQPKTTAPFRTLMVADDLETASSRSMLVLARGLAERGHQVAVASLRPEPPGFEQTDLGVPLIHAMDGADESDGRARSAWLRSVTTRFEADLVHTHGAAAIVAASSATPDGVPVVASLPAQPASADANGAGAPLAAHAWVAPTPRAAAQLQAAVRCQAERVHVIPPAVSPDACDGDGRRQPRLGRIIGVVSDLVPEARVDVFLRAVARISVAAPAVTSVVVGDGPERPALEELALGLEIRERVGFLHDRSDMAAILRRLDLLCLPGTSGAAPYAALEAMAVGVPIVATASSGIEHIARPGREAVLCAHGDDEALAAEARCVLDHRVLAWRLGWASRRRVRRGFSVARVAALHEELYQACRRAEQPVTPATEPLQLAVPA